MVPRARRHLRSLPTDVRLLATMNALGGLLCLLATIHPLADDAPVTLGRLVGAFAIGWAAFFVALGARTPHWLMHGQIASCSFAVAYMVSQQTTLGGKVLTGVVFMWVAIFATLSFSRRDAKLHVALIIVAYFVGMAADPMRGWFTATLIVSLTVAAASQIMGNLVQRLHAAADIDVLTGLLNRQSFARAAAREQAMARRTNAPLVLVLIDLDDFKVVNDRQGHAAGDLLLADLGRAWSTVLRPGDLLGRHGGDEFVLLLPATETEDAEEIIARLATASAVPWTYGLVALDPGEPLTAGLERADDRLYAAKPDRRSAARPVTVA